MKTVKGHFAVSWPQGTSENKWN